MTRVANSRFSEGQAEEGASKHNSKSSGLWVPGYSVRATSSEGFGIFLCSKESTLPMGRQILRMVVGIYGFSRVCWHEKGHVGTWEALIDKC